MLTNASEFVSIRVYWWFSVACVLLVGTSVMKSETIHYAVIGDSYSCGEGASPNESWPALLTRHLNENGIHVELVENPSRTGWTTQDAIDRELPVFFKAKPDF